MALKQVEVKIKTLRKLRKRSSNRNLHIKIWNVLQRVAQELIGQQTVKTLSFQN